MVERRAEAAPGVVWWIPQAEVGADGRASLSACAVAAARAVQRRRRLLGGVCVRLAAVGRRPVPYRARARGCRGAQQAPPRRGRTPPALRASPCAHVQLRRGTGAQQPQRRRAHALPERQRPADACAPHVLTRQCEHVATWHARARARPCAALVCTERSRAAPAPGGRQARRVSEGGVCCRWRGPARAAATPPSVPGPRAQAPGRGVLRAQPRGRSLEGGG